MSKRIILNDKEVVFNEDVSAAQDWRSLDFNRFLEALRFGSFGGGPVTPGTIQGAAIVSGLGLVTSPSNLTVSVNPGTALFGFGGLDTAFENSYQLSTSYTPVTLTLPVADVTLYRWDIIEVSAQQVTTTEIRKVLTPVGPTSRLVNTTVPKIETNQLLFRVRSGVPALLPSAQTPFLQPDPAWLPIYAVRVEPSALTTNTLWFYDLRLWLSNFKATNRLGFAADGWMNRPELFRDPLLASRIMTTQNTVTIGGYTAPVGQDIGQGPPFRANLDINSNRPSGLTPVIDKWYYLYACRPHINAGNVVLTLSDLGPPDVASSLPSGTRSGLPLPAPWPTDSASVGHYLGSVKFYDTGGGITFAFRDFLRVGDYVNISGYQLGTTPPGASTTNDFLVNPGLAAGLYTTSVSPGVGGDPTVPPHTRMVRTLWKLKAGASSASLIITTLDDFVLFEQSVDAGASNLFTLDIPLSLDGTMRFRYKVISASNVNIIGSVVGFYEGLS